MPTFITSVKLVSATEKDYGKLFQEIEKKSFHRANKPKVVNQTQNSLTIIFKSAPKTSLLEATTAVSAAAASTGKLYSFTIMKDKPNME